MTANSLTFNKELVLRGLGVAFYTRIGFLAELARGEVVAVPLANDAYSELRLGLVLPHRQPTPATRVVVRALEAALVALQAETVADRPGPA
jgi:DNA-binding transcriptional LysR family regulator